MCVQPIPETDKEGKRHCRCPDNFEIRWREFRRELVLPNHLDTAYTYIAMNRCKRQRNDGNNFKATQRTFMVSLLS